MGSFQAKPVVFQIASRHAQVAAFLCVDASGVLQEIRARHLERGATAIDARDNPVTVLISVILEGATIRLHSRLILDFQPKFIAHDIAASYGAVGSPRKNDTIPYFRRAECGVAGVQLRIIADGDAVGGLRSNRAICQLDVGLTCAIKSGKRGIKILFYLEIGKSDMASLEVDHIQLVLIKGYQDVGGRASFADEG